MSCGRPPKRSGTYMVIKVLSMHIPTSLSTAVTMPSSYRLGLGSIFLTPCGTHPGQRSPHPASPDWSTVSRLVKSLAVRAEEGVLICPPPPAHASLGPHPGCCPPACLSARCCVNLRQLSGEGRREGRSERRSGKKGSNRRREREGVSAAVWSVGATDTDGVAV